MAVARVGRPRLPVELEYAFWDRIRGGLTIKEAARAIGVSESVGERWFRKRGGVMPAVTAGPGGRRLSFADREEIALLRAAGQGVREIARAIGRDPSTVSRELRRVPVDPVPKRTHVYRASTAQADADAAAKRPKAAKLATTPACVRRSRPG